MGWYFSSRFGAFSFHTNNHTRNENVITNYSDLSAGDYDGVAVYRL
jgi:hypothetical protein